MFGTMIGSIKTVDTVLGLIKDGEEGKIEDLAKSDKKRPVLYSNGSMIKLLNKFIIEPKIIVSSSLRTNKETEDAISLNLDLFTSMYSQVFNVLTNIYNVGDDVAFDLLSSSVDSSGLSGAFESLDGLISMEDSAFPSLPINSSVVVSNEADKEAHAVGMRASIKKGESPISKLITREIEIIIKTDAKSGSKTIIVPILVKASIIYTDFSNIEKMMAVSSKDKKFLNRLDDYRAGAISLSDLVFASDLIKDYKSKRIKDVDDLIKNMENRSRSSKIKVVSAGAVGYNKYYQMIFINAEEKARIERSIAGKLSKDKYKEEFLEQTNSLTLTVLDSDWERATIYIKDLKGSSDVSFKSLSKGSKADDRMDDMLKLMMAGKTI